jgi:Ran GTPase-activating protein (RanGAP) involved in mRNA processing and transport
LATPNSLRSLHIASTNPSLETIIGALVRGCTELRHVNLSENKMVKKDATLLARFISASSSLKQLTLTRTAIPADALKEILHAIGGNVYMQDFVFEAEGNDLGFPGAQVVAEAAPKLNNVHTLDLDDNDFGDDGLAAIADGLCNNTFLKRLDIRCYLALDIFFISPILYNMF